MLNWFIFAGLERSCGGLPHDSDCLEAGGNLIKYKAEEVLLLTSDINENLYYKNSSLWAI